MYNIMGVLELCGIVYNHWTETVESGYDKQGNIVCTRIITGARLGGALT